MRLSPSSTRLIIGSLLALCFIVLTFNNLKRSSELRAALAREQRLQARLDIEKNAHQEMFEYMSKNLELVSENANLKSSVHILEARLKAAEQREQQLRDEIEALKAQTAEYTIADASAEQPSG